MNKIDIILREAKGTILTRKEFDSLASKYHFDTEVLRRVMLNKGYLITIFRGVYYLKSYEEKKFHSLHYSAYELLSLGLEKKNVTWYFGLHTALKFLHLTHEVFPVHIVINTRFNRTKPMTIAGSRFFFVKLKPSLFFDIKKVKTNNNIALFYSRLEKTLLDMIYLKKSVHLKEYTFNRSLFLRRSKSYNRVVKKRIEEMFS